jgi:hypothetical protein
MRFRTLVIALASAAAVGAAACTSSSGNQAPPAPAGPDADVVDDSGLVGCSTQDSGLVYAQNLKEPGKAGHAQFVLVASYPCADTTSCVPAPPAKGTNTWVVQVLDSSGNPAQGVSFPSVAPTAAAQSICAMSCPRSPVWACMPLHGHCTSAEPDVTANADGTFTITPLYFMMIGLWDITLNVTSGTNTDSVVYTFCVPG